MNARTAVEMLGPVLIGRFITTEAIGAYPGGRAEVIELDPDPNWKNEEGKSEIGIFEWEEIYL